MPEGELPDGGVLCEPPGPRLLLLLLFQLGQQEAELVCKMWELGIFKGSLWACGIFKESFRVGAF